MQLSDEVVAHCRLLDAQDVAEALRLPKDDEQHKWGCPACGSSDALHVYPGADRGAYCFSCDEGFDAIALVEAVTGQDFVNAVQWLASEFGFARVEAEDRTDYKQRIQKKVEKRRREREREQQKRRERARPILEELYRHLVLGPSGRDYVESRGLDWQEARDVGLRSVGTDRQWSNLRSKFSDEDLKAAGLAGESDGEMYPVPWRTPFLAFDYRLEDGSIDLLRFRHLDAGEPKYLSPLRLSPVGPYLRHAYELADTHETLYVCEGEIDALSVASVDHPAVASPGNGVWEADWCEGFRWFGQVVVLVDGDEAGRRFSDKVYDQTCQALGSSWAESHLTRRIFQDGVDANDVLQQQGRDTLEDVLNVE